MPQRTVISMHFFAAGLISLFISSIALGQITGEVESMGFNSTYRPDCFTPMIVRIKPQPGMGGLYVIQVKQKDADGDDVLFERTISVTGDDSSHDQRFATYFLPTPINQGLPDPMTGATLRDLQKELKVFLCTTSGKEIATLPITSTITNVDPPRELMSSRRGTHMIVAVCGNGSSPSWSEFQDAGNLLGVMEDTTFVQIGPRDLPEDPVAYDAVDAIVWMNVDPAELKRGGDEKFRALQTYVRHGGSLVLCQSPQWQQYLEFGDLLPVELQGIDSKKELQPLRTLARSAGPQQKRNPKTNTWEKIADPWETLTGPFTMARAQAKPNTVIDEWINWNDKGDDRTPYIVRQGYGLGAVTWVAQDLGDPAITSRAKAGWVYVWDKVFDWKEQNRDRPLIVDKYTIEDDKRPWRSDGGHVVDMGPGVIEGITQSGTVSSLVALAVAFFIVYWVIAGPGLFAYLHNKRRQNLNWFGFVLSAMIATAVTVLIVKLVVRGPPVLKHNSVVEQAAGEAAHVRSNFSLYIKQDGNQKIELKDSAPGAVTTLTSIAKHPDYITGSIDSTSAIEYDVPVRDVDTPDPPAITVPYRSTMKQFTANWYGDAGGKIEGSAKLVDPPKMIDGVLSNGTGKKLEDVYIAFKYPGQGVGGGDYILWLKSWDAGVSVDLARAFYMNDKGDRTSLPNHDRGLIPGTDKTDRLAGPLNLAWQEEVWNPFLRHQAGAFSGEPIRDLNQSFVVLSLFDRLQPIENQTTDTEDRVDLLRRGARHLDRSAALSAGSLVILARSYGPIPVPLEVEGDKMTGDGPVYYQFVLPLQRDGVSAATQPAETSN
jgi:hypothetical protein